MHLDHYNYCFAPENIPLVICLHNLKSANYIHLEIRALRQEALQFLLKSILAFETSSLLALPMTPLWGGRFNILLDYHSL